MRLTRRRRRSLHDLDVGSANYGSFRENIPDDTREQFDWVEALLTDRERQERRERRQRHQEAVARPSTLRPSGTDTPYPTIRHIVQPAYRETIQLNERIPDQTLRRSVYPTETLANVQDRLKQQLIQHIQRRWPGSIDEWEYAFDISRSAVAAETNITLTARRPHGPNRPVNR